MVLTDSPWAVWAWRLASSTTFWLAHDLGRCTRVASPSTHTASPERAISPSHRRSSSRVVMKVPSGWQYPMAASSPSSRSRLSPTSVLERSEEHTSELQSRENLVCRLLLEKKKNWIARCGNTVNR